MKTKFIGISLVILCCCGLTGADKTTLLPDSQLNSIVEEASGSLAKDSVIALAEMHRVQGSPGFHEAALYIAKKAQEYGLEKVQIETFPVDGKTTYNSFRSYFGWEAESGVLTEPSSRQEVIADYSKLRVALADYSNDSDVTADLMDVGLGTSEKDYAGKDVKGKIVLAGGNVAEVYKEAVELRKASGVLSYQPNQTTGWSGDYQDNVRWGHLSPYKKDNTFAFMISLRQARNYQKRLAAGEKIQLHAMVKARMMSAQFEVVTGVIPGTDPNAGEIVFSCHLCHQKPGANDNASGAATILEDARLLVTLIRQGKLPRPKRTIRFIWPPEIAGTACYFARHPDEVRAMRAAIHMDMVGGSQQITKAIFHLTHTPVSLPSYVNDVAAVFAEYVMNGSRRAAMEGDFSDAMLSPDGTKEMLVADFYHFTMGSDHDVYQEGSFRIPTIYLNDWPDVFIHTNNDTPANIDATKLQRVAVIGAASGYFLASAGPAESIILAGEVLTRGQRRQAEALGQALAVSADCESNESCSEMEEAENRIQQAGSQERETLLSIQQLAPKHEPLKTLLGEMQKQVDSRKKDASAILHTRYPNSSTSTGNDEDSALQKLLPKRNPAVIGGLSVYYYDYFEDHLPQENLEVLKKLGALPQGEIIRYEALNLIDGRKNIFEIKQILNAAYGNFPEDLLLDYMKLLEKAGVISITQQ
jgi:aminopeptidase YwaD